MGNIIVQFSNAMSPEIMFCKISLIGQGIRSVFGEKTETLTSFPSVVPSYAFKKPLSPSDEEASAHISWTSAIPRIVVFHYHMTSPDPPLCQDLSTSGPLHLLSSLLLFCLLLSTIGNQVM